ncbi:MAG: MFS transporter [Pseudohongiella sp.]|nr:MFS transporter [Pseudohongiella sp.]MDO9520913.1 MFS transporter [Pseudohongiella sp.]MDP2128024.1 MFS transporter [Pseudohongiella sp.]
MIPAADDATEKKISGWRALAVYGERRVLVMLLLGFSAGLPFLLIFDTLSVWLRQSGLSLQTISIFALATLSYALKFIWAPVIDRVKLPVLDGLLGRRRSWMLLMQLIIMTGLWFIAGSSPELNIWRVAALAAFVGFAGATQDIVIDAWRIEAVDESRSGAMAAAYQWGYRIAMIVAGAVPLFLAEAFSWNFSYAVMAGLMSIGMLGVLLAPRENTTRPFVSLVADLPKQPLAEALEWAVRLLIIVVAALLIGSGVSGNAGMLQQLLLLVGGSAESGNSLLAVWRSTPTGIYLQVTGVLVGLGLLALACLPLPGKPTRPGMHLRRAYGEPLANFFGRFGTSLGGLILALICLYRLSDFVLNLMGPFYVDLGFSLSQIAEVRKIFGVVALMAGVAVAGYCVARFGVLRTMLIGVFASPFSNLVFIWLATRGPDVPALYVAITIDNLATGFAGTALIAYMSSLTSAGFTATQYALFSSLYALLGKLVASQSGRVVEAAARSAEAGSPLSALMPAFAQLPEGSLAIGAANAGVSPAALGAGYTTFFLYSVAIGLLAIILAFKVAARQQHIQNVQ